MRPHALCTGQVTVKMASISRKSMRAACWMLTRYSALMRTGRTLRHGRLPGQRQWPISGNSRSWETHGKRKALSGTSARPTALRKPSRLFCRKSIRPVMSRTVTPMPKARLQAASLSMMTTCTLTAITRRTPSAGRMSMPLTLSGSISSSSGMMISRKTRPSISARATWPWQSLPSRTPTWRRCRWQKSPVTLAMTCWTAKAPAMRPLTG